MQHKKRILVKSSVTTEEEIKRFLMAKRAKGLADKTLETYQQHFSAIGKHLDLRLSMLLFLIFAAHLFMPVCLYPLF